jgi:hypothetical protein
MVGRPTPFDLAFGPMGEERFPGIRSSLESSGHDPQDLDSFVLDREVVSLLRALVPEEGAGEAVEQHLALLHHAFLYWAEGGWVFRLSAEGAQRMIQQAPEGAVEGAPRAYYLQFPDRLVWAEVGGPGAAHEPLDGMFVRPWPDGGYFVLAVFGLYPSREGFTVVEADGYRESEARRADGSDAFAPVLPGGATAGLYSIVGPEELIELAARTVPLAAETAQRAGRARPHEALEIG